MLAEPLVVEATGARPDRVARYGPSIFAALTHEAIDERVIEIGAVATIARECPQFRPMTELYPRGVTDPASYFEAKYGSGTAIGVKLGNVQPGDGYRFRGRGFIQLTGGYNYARVGTRIGVDLVAEPDKALDGPVAATIFAAYFKDRGVAAACRRRDWRAVQKLVNGGMIGWAVFARALAVLGESVNP
jgi:hypothetical protein